jgi:hypothetical protein
MARHGNRILRIESGEARQGPRRFPPDGTPAGPHRFLPAFRASNCSTKRRMARLRSRRVVGAVAAAAVVGLPFAARAEESTTPGGAAAARSTERSGARGVRGRHIVVETPTGGGKYPFLVVVRWEDGVHDPRVSSRRRSARASQATACAHSRGFVLYSWYKQGCRRLVPRRDGSFRCRLGRSVLPTRYVCTQLGPPRRGCSLARRGDGRSSRNCRPTLCVTLSSPDRQRVRDGGGFVHQ